MARGHGTNRAFHCHFCARGHGRVVQSARTCTNPRCAQRGNEKAVWICRVCWDQHQAHDPEFLDVRTPESQWRCPRCRGVCCCVIYYLGRTCVHRGPRFHCKTISRMLPSKNNPTPRPLPFEKKKPGRRRRQTTAPQAISPSESLSPESEAPDDPFLSPPFFFELGEPSDSLVVHGTNLLSDHDYKSLFRL